MYKVQTVGLHRLTTTFDNRADSLSSMRRIQRFLANYVLNLDLITCIIFRLLPHQCPCTWCYLQRSRISNSIPAAAQTLEFQHEGKETDYREVCPPVW